MDDTSGSSRRIQLTPKIRDIIGYRISPVYSTNGGLATAAIMSSMISGEVISSMGGGGEFLTLRELDALRSDPATRTAIRAHATKQQPKSTKVLVALDQGRVYKDVAGPLCDASFAFHHQITIGTTVVIEGEIFDTKIEEAKAIPGVNGISIGPEIKPT